MLQLDLFGSILIERSRLKSSAFLTACELGAALTLSTTYHSTSVAPVLQSSYRILLQLDYERSFLAALPRHLKLSLRGSRRVAVRPRAEATASSQHLTRCCHFDSISFRFCMWLTVMICSGRIRVTHAHGSSMLFFRLVLGIFCSPAYAVSRPRRHERCKRRYFTMELCKILRRFNINR